MQTKRLLAEFVGAFALVFVGAGAAAVGVAGVEGIALAHGLILMVVVYAFGDLSGAHVNPAVTFALWLRREIGLDRASGYVVVQLLGGIAAGFGLSFALGGPQNQLGATLLASGVTVPQGFFLEAVLTFLLATAVFRAAVRGQAGKAAGAAIGMTLAASILIAGPLTGASLNPARTIGPALASGATGDLWLYFAAPLTGGALAALLDGLMTR